MFRKQFAIVSLLSTMLLQGDMVDDSIANIINKEHYEQHRYLIDEVVANKNFYFQNNTLNYSKFLQILKDKSLIDFVVPEQTESKIIFHLKSGDKKGFKILKNVLLNIGYSYYFTDFIKYENEEIVWQIRFTSDYPFDPYNFNNELIKFNTQITDIYRNDITNWEYTIDATHGIIEDFQVVNLDEKVSLPMPLEPYYLTIPNGKELLIASSQGNSWIPKISFYDTELNSLGTIEMDKVYESLKVLIPQKTKYIKISDRYTLLNIKRGLSILVSNSL